MRSASLCALLCSLALVACTEGEDAQPEAGSADASATTDDSGEESSTETGQDPTLPSGERPELGGPCAQTPVETGISVGQISANITGTDQWGEPVSLYEDLCSNYVLVVRAGLDCGECNAEASTFNEYYELYADQGFMVVSLIHHSVETVGIDEQNLWANTHGLRHLVLADNDFERSDPIWPGNGGRPLLKLLGPGAEVIDTFVEPGDVPALFE